MLKEPHLTPEKMLSRLGVAPGTLGSFALVPGPRERSEKLRRRLDNATKSFSFLEYEMHTGSYGGKRVTVGNGGRYAADTAITSELLCVGGVEWLIRVGSCGGLQPQVNVGDLVVVTGALRGEGTTPYYVPQSFSATAHPEVVRALGQAAEALGVRHHQGWVYTTDALFRETPELISQLAGQGVAAIDMVTSAFLTVAQVRGRRAGAILAVSDNCLTGTTGFRDPQFLAAEEKILDVALKAVELL